MKFRKVGRIAIDLLAGALVLTGIASLAGVPARFSHSPQAGGTNWNDHTYLFQSGSDTPSSPAPACAQPTLIGRVVVPSVTARKWPSRDAPGIATFRRINPQGATQVFDLEGDVVGSGGIIWFKALLPIRPNGTTGYLPAGSVRIVQTSYRIVVDRHRLRLTLWKGCRTVKRFKIGLGKESTPTPNGRFYIISLLKPPSAGSVYGKYAYGLSAFSNAITDWKDGGVIGLHGTNDPSSIGDRKSHGCIRLYNWDISKLVPLLPLGTPVQIR